VVTAKSRDGLAGLVKSAITETPDLEIFPIVESVCRDEEITQGRLAAMARSIHESYRRQIDHEADQRGRELPADVEWNELDPALQQQNVDAAQATWDALASVGYRVVPLHSEVAEQFAFPESQIEELAAREHARWFAAKYPGRAPPAWGDVDQADKDKTCRQIREIPRVLAFAGLQIEESRF
jgi:hypothetical protein